MIKRDNSTVCFDTGTLKGFCRVQFFAKFSKDKYCHSNSSDKYQIIMYSFGFAQNKCMLCLYVPKQT